MVPACLLTVGELYTILQSTFVIQLLFMYQLLKVVEGVSIAETVLLRVTPLSSISFSLKVVRACLRTCVSGHLLMSDATLARIQIHREKPHTNKITHHCPPKTSTASCSKFLPLTHTCTCSLLVLFGLFDLTYCSPLVLLFMAVIAVYP